MRTIINGTTVSVSSDSRFQSWAKIADAQFIDLSQYGAYRLQNGFLHREIDVALSPLQYLCIGAQTGSRAHHYYDYYCLNHEGEDILDGGLKHVLREIERTVPGIYTGQEYNDCASPAGIAALYVVVANRLGDHLADLPLLCNIEHFDANRIVRYWMANPKKQIRIKHNFRAKPASEYSGVIEYRHAA